VQVCLTTVILPCFVASQGRTRQPSKPQPWAHKPQKPGCVIGTQRAQRQPQLQSLGVHRLLRLDFLPDWNNSRNPSHKRSHSALSAMLQHQALKASGLHCTRTSVSGGRFAAGPRTAGKKAHRRRLSIKTFSGLAAVQGPSFESLDSDDLLSPLATGVSVVVRDWCRRL
jgi:hypothetical protein